MSAPFSLDETIRRHNLGLPELSECNGCRDGIVEREMDDYDPDFGASYVAVNGCRFEAATRCWLCPKCARDTTDLLA